MLATLDDLEVYLGLTSGNTDEVLLGDLLARASGIVERICDRQLALTTHTEKRNGNGAYYLPLREGPIVAVTSLSISNQAFDPSRYTFDDNGIYLLDTVFPRRPQCVSIVYQAGFATIPDEIVQAVVHLAALMYRGKDRLGESSRSIGGGTTSFSADDLPPKLQEALADFKRVVPV